MVADTPYTETVEAARGIGYHLYEIRSGSEPRDTQLTAKR